MTQLSPEAKDLLAQFRRADRLEPRAHERMARGLFDKLARGEATLSGIDAPPPPLPELSWTAKLWGSAAAKLSTGVLVVAAGVTTASLTTVRTPAPEVAPSQPSAASPEPASPDAAATAAPVLAPPPTLEPAPVPLEPTAAALPRPAAASRMKPPRSRSSIRTRAPMPPAAVEPPPLAAAPAEPARPPPAVEPEREPESITPHRVTSPLDSELGLLRRAYLELNASRPARAIEALDEHAYRFPKGELVEAREVARMLALCGLDREPEARALAKKFLKAHPGSPFTGRVRALCPMSLPKTSP